MAEARSQCVACIEPIHPRARVCPHCGSRQQGERWHFIAASLRWAGGATALLTVVLASFQIHDIYAIWSQRQTTVVELVRAADEEKKLGELERAWRTLDVAREIDDASPLVHEARLELAHVVARERTIWKEEEWGGPSGSLVDVLFRGAASSDDESSARAYAHLAWINVRRVLGGGAWLKTLWEVASPLLLRALDRDPQEPYANAIWGYLVLYSNQAGTAEERLATGIEYFERARPQNEEQADFIRGIELAGFSRGPTIAKIEGLRRGLTILEAGGVIEEGTQKRNLELLHGLPYLALDSPDERDLERYVEPSRLLVEAFTYQQLDSVFRHMIGDQAATDAGMDTSATGRRRVAAVLAYLHEMLGRREEALTLQQKIFDDHMRDGPQVLATLALERLGPPAVSAPPEVHGP